MNKKQITFLVIAVLYLVFNIINTLRYPVGPPTTGGWHTTITYNLISVHYFTSVYYLAISAIYADSRIANSRLLFIAHVIFSMIPLATVVCWPLFFDPPDYNLDDMQATFDALFYLEWFFIFSQAFFILSILYIRHRKQPDR